MGSTYLSFRHHHSHPAMGPSSSFLLSSSSPIIKIRLRVNVGVQVPCCRRHHHPSDRELVFDTLVVYFIASLVFTVSSILSVESWYYSIFSRTLAVISDKRRRGEPASGS